MNREDYQKVKEIFQSALDLASDERTKYLNEKCSDNPSLRCEVERLLDSFDNDYLEQPAVEKFAETVLSKSNLSIGQEIGHYKIVKKIGAGGMGEVFLAEDVRLKRKIALKILPAAVSQNKNYLRRFEQEAYAASALNHPNILTVHEFGDENGTNFIATEFVEGKTLRERLISNERLSLSETLDIVLQIVAALSAAHDAGIIHRDIKPENIMIRADGLVKVLDFGLAKLTLKKNEVISGENNTQINTTQGMIMGTAAYMSPEQARGKKNDARSDIFSFGIVFYEMLTGRRAFEGETTLESISSILKDEPQPISQILPEVPHEIERIVHKTLRKDRKERYQTAKDLLIDLKSAKHELELHDSLGRVPNQNAIKTQSLPATPTNENRNQLTASAEYFVKQVKDYKFIYLTIAALLIAGIGFGIYRYSDSQPTNIPFESVKITKITDSGNIEEKVALSRDGKWLAYSIVEGGKASLWLKQVAVPDSNTQIAPPAQIYYRELSFSPDSNYLYYSVLEGTANNMTVYQMPVLGGTPRKFLSGINGGINFSPDGKQITYGVEDLENDESILMIADADASEPRELVKLKGNDEIASSRGHWSPDGKLIALWVGTNNPKTQELATISVETGEITRLETHKFSEFGLREWLPDGKGFVVLAREKPAQNSSFWQISFPSPEAQKITNDLNNVYSSMSLANEANMLATVQKSVTASIWIAPVSDPSRATEIISNGTGPQWTPDGKLVYIRALSESNDLYMVDPHGGNPKALTSNQQVYEPNLLPDGRYIVYMSKQNGTPNIWRIDIDGGNPKQLTTEFSVEPNISPDSREVIYTVGVDTTRIWKVGMDGGQPVQLTDHESRNPVFSPDGKQFICQWWDSPNSQRKIAIVPSTGGKPVKTFALNIDAFRWMPDGRSFVYLDNKNGVKTFWSQPIDGGTPKQLPNSIGERIWSLNLSPDGKQIALTRGTETRDVVLISGFRR